MEHMWHSRHHSWGSSLPSSVYYTSLPCSHTHSPLYWKTRLPLVNVLGVISALVILKTTGQASHLQIGVYLIETHAYHLQGCRFVCRIHSTDLCCQDGSSSMGTALSFGYRWQFCLAITPGSLQICNQLQDFETYGTWNRWCDHQHRVSTCCDEMRLTVSFWSEIILNTVPSVTPLT